MTISTTLPADPLIWPERCLGPGPPTRCPCRRPVSGTLQNAGATRAHPSAILLPTTLQAKNIKKKKKTYKKEAEKENNNLTTP